MGLKVWGLRMLRASDSRTHGDTPRLGVGICKDLGCLLVSREQKNTIPTESPQNTFPYSKPPSKVRFRVSQGRRVYLRRGSWLRLQSRRYPGHCRYNPYIYIHPIVLYYFPFSFPLSLYNPYILIYYVQTQSAQCSLIPVVRLGPGVQLMESRLDSEHFSMKRLFWFVKK